MELLSVGNQLLFSHAIANAINALLAIKPPKQWCVDWSGCPWPDVPQLLHTLIPTRSRRTLMGMVA
jgi:hypothetical protein